MAKYRVFNGKRYKISGGTFETKRMANTTAESARERGYCARVVKIKDKAGIGYHVYVRGRK